MSRLKVAMLVKQFSPHGGLELYAHRVVEGLLANELQVTVVCQQNESQLQHDLLGFKMIAACGGAGKRKRLENLFQNSNEALAELFAGSKNRPDLLHSQHCPNQMADLVTFHNHSCKRLSEVGLWWERMLNESKRSFVPAYKIRDKYDEILVRRAHCLIFPALVMKNDFYEAYPFLLGPPAKPFVIAHPGSSLGASEELQMQTEGSDPAQGSVFNFLFVGRGFRKKGLDILLSACQKLKSMGNSNFKLLIAGLAENPLASLRLDLLGIQKNVEYLGFQKDMDSIYRRAKVIILPSRLEPFGMAPVQGMQRGLVPIVSRVSGVAEVLSNEIDSLILNDHLNPQELALLMQRLMQDESLLFRLSANARMTAEKVSWAKTVEATLEAYEIALSLKKSSES